MPFGLPSSVLRRCRSRLRTTTHTPVSRRALTTVGASFVHELTIQVAGSLMKHVRRHCSFGLSRGSPRWICARCWSNAWPDEKNRAVPLHWSSSTARWHCRSHKRPHTGARRSSQFSLSHALGRMLMEMRARVSNGYDLMGCWEHSGRTSGRECVEKIIGAGSIHVENFFRPSCSSF
jgi:hypothetical protein